ncbi:hypothetical protein DL769_001656 [Monosporascus sp. CRB-8-3]|nr:hypothetical protein DL769_001656 [Monosporascus sp. CRB-8-3]
MEDTQDSRGVLMRSSRNPSDRRRSRSAGPSHRDAGYEDAYAASRRYRDQGHEPSVPTYASPKEGGGLVADRDIAKGTCFIEEEPVIVATAEQLTADPWSLALLLENQFRQLPRPKAEKYLTFDSPPEALSAEAREAIRAGVHSSWNDIGLDCETYFTTIAGIFERRRCELGSSAGYGVFNHFNRIRQSCMPNATFRYRAAEGKITIHAVRDIAVGEEIKLSFIDERAPREVRIRELLAKGLTCDCPACHGPRAQEHEFRRQKLWVIGRVLRIMRRDEVDGRVTTPSRLPMEELAAASLALMYVNTMLEAGLYNMALATAYYDCAIFCLRANLPDEANFCRGRAHEVALCCGLEDDEEEEWSEEGSSDGEDE